MIAEAEDEDRYLTEDEFLLMQMETTEMEVEIELLKKQAADQKAANEWAA